MRFIVCLFFSLYAIAEPVLEVPAFVAPGQSFSAPMQVGKARAARVRKSGLYQAPAEAGAFYCAGVKLPLLEGNLVFVPWVDDFYTGETVVWAGDLEVSGEPGKMRAPRPQGIVSANIAFTALCRTELNQAFHHNYMKECAPNWYFPREYDIIGERRDDVGEKQANPVIVRVEVPAPRLAGKAVLSVALNSNAARGKQNTLTIRLNGHLLVDAFSWEGPGYRILRQQFDASLLKDGANEVELLGDPIYVKYLDWVEIAALAEPRLRQESLVVAAQERGSISVAGATHTVDITVLGEERLVPPHEDQYALEKDRLYFITSETPNLSFGEEQDLKLPALEDVQYIAVATARMLPPLAPFLEHASGRKISAAAVALEDVNNVFNAGMYGPDGIVRMLEHFRPRYLLLAGGFDRDCRARLPEHAEAEGFDPGIPAGLLMVEQLTITDDPYMLNLTVNVGRVPVETPEALAAWVEKAVSYQAPDNLVLLAGKTDQMDFGAEQRSLTRRVPASVLEHQLVPTENLRSQLFQAMHNSARLVLYQGHAQSWEIDEGMLGVGDGPHMPPSSWVLATCNGAYYHAEYEAFVRDWMGTPGAGCVNALASASVGTADQQNQLIRRFLEGLRGDPALDWGGMMHFLKKNLPLPEKMMQDPKLPPFISRNIPQDKMTIDAYSFLGDPAAPILATQRREVAISVQEKVESLRVLPPGPLTLAVNFTGPWDASSFTGDRYQLQWNTRQGAEWKPVSIEAILKPGENLVPLDTMKLGIDGGTIRLRLIEKPPQLPEIIWRTAEFTQESVAPGIPAITLRKRALPKQPDRLVMVCIARSANVHKNQEVETQFQVRDADTPDTLLADSAWMTQRRFVYEAEDYPETIEARARSRKSGIEGDWSPWTRAEEAPAQKPVAATPAP